MQGVKKEYCLLPGKAAGAADDNLTVLGAAVSAFAAVPEITTIVIAVPADPINGEAAARKALPPELLAGEKGPAILFVNGGRARRASVFNALSLLAAYAPGFVLIHDGARPWVSPSLIQRVIAGVKKYRAVIPLLPLTETPKETDAPLDSAGTDAVFIKRHIKRAFMGAAQTPQGFAFPEILAAHEQAAEQEKSLHIEFTDDAEVWASFCGPVAAIPGESENRKITFPEDLVC
jgi:2-C-methyl-D-erythritol 4-phosphate cytidylyltransferase/2-C-methyl-D-erythritol 4-phosphate cytidylyltransferase/2-C-methyl-D-erythritol 2,4-cyclodiphosphate synthase